MNIRMLPPVSVPAQTRIVNGRTYSSTPGNTVDVLDSDAAELQSNGWVGYAHPAPRPRGQVPRWAYIKLRRASSIMTQRCLN
jgi:hypothetical protein